MRGRMPRGLSAEGVLSCGGAKNEGGLGKPRGCSALGLFLPGAAAFRCVRGLRVPESKSIFQESSFSPIRAASRERSLQLGRVLVDNLLAHKVGQFDFGGWYVRPNGTSLS